MSKPCLIAACDNKVGDHSRTGECDPCRAAGRRWAKRRPEEIVARMHDLRKYGERMDNLIEQPKGQKLVRAVAEGKKDVRRWTHN